MAFTKREAIQPHPQDVPPAPCASIPQVTELLWSVSRRTWAACLVRCPGIRGLDFGCLPGDTKQMFGAAKGLHLALPADGPMRKTKQVPQVELYKLVADGPMPSDHEHTFRIIRDGRVAVMLGVDRHVCAGMKDDRGDRRRAGSRLSQPTGTAAVPLRGS